MTSSNSGIYGNFGQANYSAAKMALIGLANTLAIEGNKNNIHCNVIVPTAASRMTEGILPDLLFQQLSEFYPLLRTANLSHSLHFIVEPKLIAPVVAYLCHESNEDNGAVIESAAGYATKVRPFRGEGQVLRDSLKDDVTIEYVHNVWPKVTDMSRAKAIDTISGATGKVMEVLEKLETRDAGGPQEFADEFTYTAKDIALYALGGTVLELCE